LVRRTRVPYKPMHPRVLEIALPYLSRHVASELWLAPLLEQRCAIPERSADP
jgi:hypothetical protein